METYIKKVSQIIDAMENKYYIISASSISKISNHACNSFSMVAGPKYGCPGATKACNDCYATKNRHHFPCVQKKLAKNWVSVKIHESSDFFNQWYVDRWTEVIRQRPDVMFWAYTRSFHLNFQNLVRHPNFALWASTDEFNQNDARKFIKSRFKT